MENDKFRYEGQPKLYNPSQAFVVHLTGVIGKEKLLSALNAKLKFPSYFGFNWDALYDVLRDFHWVKERIIVLVHDYLPVLDNDDLKIYLNILSDSSRDWKENEEHSFVIVFPKDRESLIKDLLR
jgi:hypothetical protein